MTECQAWDLGYSARCSNRPRWRAEKDQAIPFVLCGRHLHRARRAHYVVTRIGEP